MRSHPRSSGLGFRGRLFAFLLAFALAPSILVLLGWGATTRWALPYVGATAQWDSVSASGQRAIAGARANPSSEATRRALDEHEARLGEALVMAKRTKFLVDRTATLAMVTLLLAIFILGLLAASASGHLSRNLSRPLQELIDWTALIARGEPIPRGPPRRGAPEFQLLRDRMQQMSTELQLGRQRALEAERAAALRESARQVAHELKNPLTPIRFAIARLRGHVTPEIAEAVEVLDIESARLDSMARSFSQFGRLPDGPRAPIELGELAQYAARSTASAGVEVRVEIAADTPMVEGDYEALSRALSNVVINAVEACEGSGQVTMRVAPASLDGRPAAEIVVTDSGRGIDADKLPRVFEPYVTTKPGGTGLGLAIVRQTVFAHDGAIDATSEPGRGTSIRMILPVLPTTSPVPT